MRALKKNNIQNGADWQCSGVDSGVIFELHRIVLLLFFLLDAAKPSPQTQNICPLFVCRMKRNTGLEIISGESPDTMTGQIHFSSVTYRFWPVKLYKITQNRGP